MMVCGKAVRDKRAWGERVSRCIEELAYRSPPKFTLSSRGKEFSIDRAR